MRLNRVLRNVRFCRKVLQVLIRDGLRFRRRSIRHMNGSNRNSRFRQDMGCELREAVFH